MTEPLNSPLLDLWSRALVAEFGIIVACDDPTRTIQLLYRARAQSGDSRLNGLTIKRSPTVANEIWIMHSDRPPELKP